MWKPGHLRLQGHLQGFRLGRAREIQGSLSGSGRRKDLLEKQRGLALHPRTQTSSSLWPMVSFDFQEVSWERPAECIDCFTGPGDNPTESKLGSLARSPPCWNLCSGEKTGMGLKLAGGNILPSP